MARPFQTVQRLPVADPDNIPEILCDGQFYIHRSGAFVTLTFTHERPIAGPMFENSTLDLQPVVRARIALTVANVFALRDLLNRVLKDPDRIETASGGAGVH